MKNRIIETNPFENPKSNRRILGKKLKAESGLVKDESMKVLRDFEEIDYAG